MALLVFSNNGNWDHMHIGFIGVINHETIINHGYIKSIQDFIRDDDVLPGIYEDEHKGLDIHVINDVVEFETVLDAHEMVLWANSDHSPKFYVEVITPDEYFIYVLIKI